jgi:hypothetical protein
METAGPQNRYRYALFVEKEGFDPLWRAAGIVERYDLAIMSTKGMPTTAGRELVESLSERGVTILVLHDFDKAGFSIVNTLQSNTRRYTFGDAPNVIDLGFRLEDIEGLERETVYYKQRKDPRYNLRECGATLEERSILVQSGGRGYWVGERVELNAMTSDRLVTWLEDKLAEIGVEKVVPETEVLEEAYAEAVLRARMKRAVDEVKEKFDRDAVEVPENLADVVRDEIEGTGLAWDRAVWSMVWKEA